MASVMIRQLEQARVRLAVLPEFAALRRVAPQVAFIRAPGRDDENDQAEGYDSRDRHQHHVEGPEPSSQAVSVTQAGATTL